MLAYIVQGRDDKQLFFYVCGDAKTGKSVLSYILNLSNNILKVKSTRRISKRKCNALGRVVGGAEVGRVDPLRCD
jgi:hypothetical protein